MNLIQGLDGDVVDVERADAEQLERIAEDLRSRLRGDQGVVGTHSHSWWTQELDIIEEELEARAREEDRAEMAADDERIGL